MLVTNQLQFTKEADLIVYLADGKVEESGTYAELMDADGGYAKLMSQAEVRAAGRNLVAVCRHWLGPCSARRKTPLQTLILTGAGCVDDCG